MPAKNNITIYEQIFRPAIAGFGLWDQVVVDCGTEFFLSLFIQEHLQLYRVSEEGASSTRLPFRQIKSTANNRIERIWVEVNKRVLYPFKYAVRFLEDLSLFDMNNHVHAFVVSYLLRKFVATQLCRCYLLI
jgi:hypothetical protein